MAKVKGKLTGPREILQAIRQHSLFLVTSHMNLEGDALGSQLAMGHLIRKIGRGQAKKVWFVTETPVPQAYSFLPGSNEVTIDLSIKRKPEVVITVDCPNLERIGKVARYITDETLLITIDHHVSHSNFGRLNWVDTKASATGEMIYILYKAARVSVDKKAAINLYASIMTDTGSFAYSNTTSKTHRIVAELIDKGANPYRIQEQIYESSSLASRKLLAKVLDSMAVTEEGKVSYVTVTRQMMEETGANVDDTDGFVNYARSIQGVEVGLLFREGEEAGRVKVSFRSKGLVDVNQLANHFGGGGHRAASGCLIHASLEEAKRRVLEEVRKSLESAKNKKRSRLTY